MTTATDAHLDITRRHDFVLLFDVADGNPNGDPDAGNLPRVDPETMQGLVTDVAIKRKVRDWIDLTRGDEERYKVYIQSGGDALNTKHARAYSAKGLKSTGSRQDKGDVDIARAWMCENFFDIRMFGAVMTTGVNCGQVRGPVQITFARSHDPIIPLDFSITRVAVTKPEDAKVSVAEGDTDAKTGKQTEMGRKSMVPYGLYRAHGFVNPHFAEKSGMTAEDLDLFWKALLRMWDTDHSSARGMMSCRGIYVFSHESSLGNASAQSLFDRIKVSLKDGVEAPRSFDQYIVDVNEDVMPEGVTLTALSW